MTGFRKYSKIEWLESLPLDKGIQLTHIVDHQIKGPSFPHLDDLKEGEKYNRFRKLDGDWKISCLIEISELSKQNPLIPLSLEHGVEQLRLHFKIKPDLKSIIIQLENVLIEAIDIFVSWNDMFPDDLLEINSKIFSYYESSTLINLELEIEENSRSFEKLSEQHLSINEAILWNYNFGVFEIESWFKKLEEFYRIFNRVSIFKPYRVAIKVEFGKDFLTNISSFRALKRVLEGLEFIDPLFYLNFYNVDTEEDLNNNLIQLAIASLSASISGADSIWVCPADSFQSKQNEFWLKLALHQQHILKQESKMNLVKDPSCGSYYIEDLTNKIFNYLNSALI
ncbi:MAG: hypothetical protein IPN15_05210 [Saprospiraceae bacterium]|nr:hypothetical protein [Candidatus Vicinibacter affinis]